MRSKELQELTTKELLVIAKTYNIIGRHSLKKIDLIDSIIRKEYEQSTEAVSESPDVIEVPVTRVKADYISNLKEGTIIAFKVNDTKMLSGIVESILENNSFKVKTKTGIKFIVNRNNIVWVKTGDRWPRGVYQALRGELPNVYEEKNRTNN